VPVLVDANVLEALYFTGGTRAHELGVTGRVYTIENCVREFRRGPVYETDRNNPNGPRRGQEGWKAIQKKFNIEVLPDPKPSNAWYRRAIELRMRRGDALLAAAAKERRWVMATQDETLAGRARRLGVTVRHSLSTQETNTNPRPNPPPNPLRTETPPRRPPPETPPRRPPPETPSAPYRPQRPPTGRPPTGHQPAGQGAPPTAPPVQGGGAGVSRGARALQGAASAAAAGAQALVDKQQSNLYNDAIEQAKKIVHMGIINTHLNKGKYVIVEIDIAVGPPTILAHASLWAVRLFESDPIYNEYGQIDWNETERAALEAPDSYSSTGQRGGKSQPSGIVRPKLDEHAISLLEHDQQYLRYFPERPKKPDTLREYLRDETGKIYFDRWGRALVRRGDNLGYEYEDRCTNNRW
jgi:hypothetical protein